jgi:hypothetical protein
MMLHCSGVGIGRCSHARQDSSEVHCSSNCRRTNRFQPVCNRASCAARGAKASAQGRRSCCDAEGAPARSSAYFLTGGSTGGGASPSQSSPTCVQSSPHSSIGCCPLSVPLPQRMSSAGQKCSHPQQMRSGCPGRIGNLRFMLYGTQLALGRQARAVAGIRIREHRCSVRTL